MQRLNGVKRGLMKIFFVEPDLEFAQNVTNTLNATRLKVKMKMVQNEEEIFNETIASLLEYSLFILNLKNPIDKKVLNYLRHIGSEAPILLILENNVNRDWLKIIYYLSYDDLIIKEFYPEEIVFHVYKLCDIWNDDVFEVSKDLSIDIKHSMINYGEETIHLGRKEALFLKFLFVKSPHYVSCEELAYYIYDNEVVSSERIRSLVRQTREKLPIDIVETKRGEGYRIVNLNHQTDSRM